MPCALWKLREVRLRGRFEDPVRGLTGDGRREVLLHPQHLVAARAFLQQRRGQLRLRHLQAGVSGAASAAHPLEVVSCQSQQEVPQAP